MPGSIVASLDKFPGCCQDPTNIHVHILTIIIIIIYIYVHILPVRIIISHSFANVDYCEGCEEF